MATPVIHGVPTHLQSLADPPLPTSHPNLPSVSIHKRPTDGRGDIELPVVHKAGADVELQEQPNVPENITPSVTSKNSKRTADIQFATLCWTLLLAEWNDGTTGPLLPRIQSVYHVRLVPYLI